jgi:hypothetical protein
VVECACYRDFQQDGRLPREKNYNPRGPITQAIASLVGSDSQIQLIIPQKTYGLAHQLQASLYYNTDNSFTVKDTAR